MPSILRYELVSSADAVTWKPLSRLSRDLHDAVSGAEIEMDLRESSDRSDWVGIFDHKNKRVVWKRPPGARGRRWVSKRA
jgi:hypothetical protein